MTGVWRVSQHAPNSRKANMHSAQWVMYLNLGFCTTLLSLNQHTTLWSVATLMFVLHCMITYRRIIINFFLIFSCSKCGTILHGPVREHTWTGVLSVLDGHSHKDTECCKDTAPAWQEDWWTEPCSGRQGEPSACPSLWGSVVGGSGPCPAENTCNSPLCPLFCGNDGQTQAGSDLCDPWRPLSHGTSLP